MLAPSDAGKAVVREVARFDKWLDENSDAGVVIDSHNIMHRPVYSEVGFAAMKQATNIRGQHMRKEQNMAAEVTRERRPVKELNRSRVCVGNLHQDVTPQVLQDFFSGGGQVPGVQAILQQMPERHSGQGEVHFKLQKDALRAVQAMNGSTLFGSTISVVDSGTTPRGLSKVRIGNIHSDMRWQDVKKHLTTETATPQFVRLYDMYYNGREVQLLHDGRGEVQFESKQDAEKAVQNLNGKILNGNKLHVRMDTRWKERITNTWMGDRYQTTVDYFQSRGVKAVGVCKKHIIKDNRNKFLQHYERDGSLYVLPNDAIDDLFVLYAALKLGLKKPGVNIVAGVKSGNPFRLRTCSRGR